MKIIRAAFPWLVLLLSFVLYAAGWYIEREARLSHFKLSPDFEQIYCLISTLGNLIMFLGFIGVLTAATVFATLGALKKSERRIHLLEDELSWLRQTLPPLTTVSRSTVDAKRGQEEKEEAPERRREITEKPRCSGLL